MSVLDVLLSGRPRQLLERGGIVFTPLSTTQDQQCTVQHDLPGGAAKEPTASNPSEDHPAEGEAVLAPRVQKRKRYTDRTPSNHCHICSRSVGAVKMAVCSNLHSGLCRKVICKLCCESFELGWGVYEQGHDWQCTHCKNACPVRARCHTYHRTNMRRRISNLNTRKEAV
mmetsp:Transcript_5473/g.16314  ORF Transcript_5473/g.16314 Transcript_5473/m.16314 type:complete len:170 (-) Transcript_5473:167-676(-)